MLTGISIRHLYVSIFLTFKSRSIVFVWSRNGANKTKAIVKGLLAPEMKIVGGTTKHL